MPCHHNRYEHYRIIISIVMGIYPLLSASQQQNLPKLIKATPLPSLFEDSTHQLWQCDTDAGDLFLKVCDSQAVQRSSFWQGMKAVFGLDLSAQLGDFKPVYQQLTVYSSLEIPTFIASDSASAEEKGFLLTRYISGETIDGGISDKMVANLAEHLADLHKHTCHQWGKFPTAQYDAASWTQSLSFVLEKMVQQQGITRSSVIENAIISSRKCHCEIFIPMMMDLRWDQFLQQSGKLTALVDLDAFVFAPRELDFVLLEYLLDARQVTIFINVYRQYHEIPTINAVRSPYRLLLFLLGVLAERNEKKWLAADSYFN